MMREIQSPFLPDVARGLDKLRSLIAVLRSFEVNLRGEPRPRYPAALYRSVILVMPQKHLTEQADRASSMESCSSATTSGLIFGTTGMTSSCSLANLGSPGRRATAVVSEW